MQYKDLNTFTSPTHRLYDFKKVQVLLILMMEKSLLLKVTKQKEKKGGKMWIKAWKEIAEMMLFDY